LVSPALTEVSVQRRICAVSGSANVKKLPIVTYTVIGLCVLVYVGEMVNWRSVETVLDSLLGAGGLQRVFGLLAVTLVHSRLSPMHIVFNLLAFSVLGRLIEMMYGPLRLVLLLIGLAFVSSAAQLLFAGIGIGLSGVVYGIFGFMLGAAPRNPYLWWFVKKNAAMLIGWAVLAVVLTQMHVMQIANYAHFGGLIYGAIIGLIYGLPRFRPAFLGLAVLIPVVLLVWSWNA
jgi:membrane associated rhomboid family serine protease